jgi:hypothetical protein
LLRPSERQLAAIARLRGDGEFAVVVEFLEAARADALHTLSVTTDEVRLRWMQGEAQTLGDLLDLIKQSRQ